VVNATPQPFFPLDTNPVRVTQEAEWNPALFLTGEEKLSPTGIRSPDLNNNSLLSDTHANSRHSAPHIGYINIKFCIFDEISVLDSLLFTT
jgi:hypothetical protein